MKTRVLCLILIVFGFNSNFAQKINGISFVASKNKIGQEHVKPIKAVYGNYVALIPFGFIKNLNHPEISFNSNHQWFGETKKGLKQYANEFRKEQIKIMVKPQIWVWQGAYTGFIKMHSDEHWKVLEQSYEKFILDYAKVATEIEADIFCIGTELEAFVKTRPNYWLELIKKIRKIYNGKITYAANWDEFKRVSFWSSLDYIGIDAYFPVSLKKTPSILDCKEGWKTHKETILAITKKFNKPILFTEFGYKSANFTAKEPWDSSKKKYIVNFQAQANATQALFEEFWNEDWFAGGFMWKWYQNHSESGGITNAKFTPQNKPVEKVIQKFYKSY